MAKLTPADCDRCQAERGGVFMLGPGRMRCTNKPTVIATEVKAGADGQRGSMPLCTDCLSAFKKRMPAGYAAFESVDERKDDDETA